MLNLITHNELEYNWSLLFLATTIIFNYYHLSPTSPVLLLHNTAQLATPNACNTISATQSTCSSSSCQFSFPHPIHLCHTRCCRCHRKQCLLSSGSPQNRGNFDEFWHSLTNTCVLQGEAGRRELREAVGEE